MAVTDKSYIITEKIYGFTSPYHVKTYRYSSISTEAGR